MPYPTPSRLKILYAALIQRFDDISDHTIPNSRREYSFLALFLLLAQLLLEKSLLLADMMTPNELIKEVTRLVLKDHICYVQKSDRIITAFDMERIDGTETMSEVAILEDSAKHIKIGQMPKELYLREMRDFLDVLTDDDIRKELHLGLSRKNPARNFLQTVENRIDINQHWRRYMAERYEVYVEEVLIRAYNP